VQIKLILMFFDYYEQTSLSSLLSCCFDLRKHYKNSSGDEIANVLVNDDIAHT